MMNDKTFPVDKPLVQFKFYTTCVTLKQKLLNFKRNKKINQMF